MESNLAKNSEIRTSCIIAKIKSGQMQTLTIEADSLRSYLDAGSATDFRVEKIANEGEWFPHKERYTSDIDLLRGKYNVGMERVQEGSVAISVESRRQKGGKGDFAAFDFAAFWTDVWYREGRFARREMIEDGKLRGKKFLIG